MYNGKCASFDLSPFQKVSYNNAVEYSSVFLLKYFQDINRVKVDSNFSVFVFLHKKEFLSVNKELKSFVVFEGKILSNEF